MAPSRILSLSMFAAPLMVFVWPVVGVASAEESQACIEDEPPVQSSALLSLKVSTSKLQVPCVDDTTFNGWGTCADWQTECNLPGKSRPTCCTDHTGPDHALLVACPAACGTCPGQVNPTQAPTPQPTTPAPTPAGPCADDPSFNSWGTCADWNSWCNTQSRPTCCTIYTGTDLTSGVNAACPAACGLCKGEQGAYTYKSGGWCTPYNNKESELCLEHPEDAACLKGGGGRGYQKFANADEARQFCDKSSKCKGYTESPNAPNGGGVWCKLKAQISGTTGSTSGYKCFEK